MFFPLGTCQAHALHTQTTGQNQQCDVLSLYYLDKHQVREFYGG